MPVADDPDNAERDRLWNRTFDALYDTLYNEIEVGTYIRRLEFVNTVATAMATMTALSGVGALIANLTIWKSPTGQWLWAALLVIAAILIGTNRALVTPTKIPDLQRLVRDLIGLRNDLEEFRSVMAANPDFNATTARKKYEALAERCKELTGSCPVSFLLHLRVRQECQAETDFRLKNYILVKGELDVYETKRTATTTPEAG